MGKRFIQKIPGKPVFKRDSYTIPDSYSAVYEDLNITDVNEQAMLFYVTQFGGFRLRKIPKYILEKERFITEWFKVKREGRTYSFRAKPKFLTIFGDIELEPLQRRWRIDSVNDEEMQKNGFSNEEIRESHDFLSKLNEFYSSLRIGISVPASGISLEDRVNLSRFHGIPFLMKKPRAGGRFFHPGSSYQRIESSLRELITINGERTSEVDISAATLQFLGIVLKEQAHNPIMDEILSNGDPYQYFLKRINSDLSRIPDGEVIQREDIKPLLFTTIYSPKKTQKSNVAYKLRRMDMGYKYNDFIELLPEFFCALDALKSKTKFLPHMTIFREESRYAQEVLKTGCLEKGIPILPIHDSFITTRDNVSELKRTMDTASKKLYGKYLKYKVKY